MSEKRADFEDFQDLRDVNERKSAKMKVRRNKNASAMKNTVAEDIGHSTPRRFLS